LLRRSIICFSFAVAKLCILFHSTKYFCNYFSFFRNFFLATTEYQPFSHVIFLTTLCRLLKSHPPLLLSAFTHYYI
jgi:hypothetical protein